MTVVSGEKERPPPMLLLFEVGATMVVVCADVWELNVNSLR